MSIKEKDIEIGGKKYRIKQLTGTKSTKLFLTLTKISSGAFGGLNASSPLDSNIGDMVRGLSSNLDVDKFTEIIKDTISTENSIVEPVDFDFDLDFAGCMDDAILLLIEILKFNYEKAIKKLKKKLSHLFPKTKPMLKEVKKTTEKTL